MVNSGTRLRHQRLASVDPVVLRKQLQRQRLLVAHTIYECPRCDAARADHGDHQQSGGIQRLQAVLNRRNGCWVACRRVIDTLDPVEQEKHLRYNHLVANAAAIQNVIDLTRAVPTLQTDGYIIQRDDLAQLSPYQTRRLK